MAGRFGAILSSLSLAAGQSVRRNAGDSAFEAYTPFNSASDTIAYTQVNNLATARLVGRTTAGTGALEAISIGSGLSLSAGTLSATGGGLSIGSAVSGGGANRLLYEDGSQNLASDPNLTFTSSAFTAEPSSTVYLGGSQGVDNAAALRVRRRDVTSRWIDFVPSRGGTDSSIKTWNDLYLEPAGDLRLNPTAGRVYFPGGGYLVEFASGSWLNLPTSGPSAVGTGGAGSNPMLAYCASGAQWFTDSSAGDNAIRNTGGKLLFGNTSGSAGMSLGSDKLGIGVYTASAKLHVLSTTEQFRAGYDASNYFSATVGSTGAVTFDAVGSGAKFTFSDAISFPLGGAISGGGANRLLYEDGSQNLATSANLTFDGSYKLAVSQNSSGGIGGELAFTNTNGTTLDERSIISFTSGASLRSQIVSAVRASPYYGSFEFWQGVGSMTQLLHADNGRFGVNVGNAPAAALHVISTAEQQRLGYSVSQYWSATTDSAGTTTFNAVGTTPKFVIADDLELSGSLSIPAIAQSGAQLSLDKTASGAVGPVLRLYNNGGAVSDAGAIVFRSTTQDRARISFEVIDGSGNGGIIFGTGPSFTEAMRIEGAGSKIGIGTGATISARMHVISTTEQFRAGYDASNYFSATAGSTGAVTFDAVGSGAKFIFSDCIEPPSMADSSAPNNSIYYSTTASKLVYKDSGGTVNNLY